MVLFLSSPTCLHSSSAAVRIYTGHQMSDCSLHRQPPNYCTQHVTCNLTKNSILSNKWDSFPSKQQQQRGVIRSLEGTAHKESRRRGKKTLQLLSQFFKSRKEVRGRGPCSKYTFFGQDPIQAAVYELWLLIKDRNV